MARMAQGHRTLRYPQEAPLLPARFRGMPAIDSAKCATVCGACGDCCPVEAIATHSGKPRIDMGRCLFCGQCAAECPEHAITFSQEHRLAARQREDLIVDGQPAASSPTPLDDRLLRLFKRSFRLRQVSAGGCNACEADTNVLNTITYDLGRFGIQFVASPRHADGLLVTGPVTRNMETALRKTYDATPAPKIVIAVGACAISGGLFAEHGEVHHGVAEILPVDLFVPGCPPHPLTILNGLLSLLGKTR